MREVTFTWKGIDYVVEKNKTIDLVDAIEEVVTLGELHEYLDFKKARFGKVAGAYSAALTFAGCKVTPDEVHDALFAYKQGKEKDALFVKALTKLISIIQPMVPPEHLQEKGDGKKKEEAATPAADLSKRRTKRPSPGN